MNLPVTDASKGSVRPHRIRWQGLVLTAASLQCLVWGLFIILLPSAASVAYGFAKPPQELFLWQGLGLVILLYGLGYGIAATEPHQHWGLVLTGLVAKILGPVGMCWAVFQGDAPWTVLIQLPINDVVWWIPFAVIVQGGWRHRRIRRAELD
jgi:hypothetical protein